jgi:predicted HicB family RNase H-like nuclease
VRFTVDLPRSLHKRLKLAALNRDEAMTDLARRALTEWLDSQV